MQKTLIYGLKALKFSWKANGFYSILDLASKIYESTLYPFIQVLLLAQLLDLFTQPHQTINTKLFWIIMSYLIASGLKLVLKSFMDVKETYLQFRFESYLDMQISKKLTELDPATFENPEFQDLLAQLDGVKGTLQSFLMGFTALINAIFKFITATLVVSVTFPLFAPIILLATVPSYLAWDKMRGDTWPYFTEKRSHMARVTQYIKTLLSSDSTSKEAIIFQTGSVLLKKIKKEQNLYLNSFNNVTTPWVVKILFTSTLQFCVFLYTQYLNLSKVLQGTLSIGQFTLVFQQSLNLTLSSSDILNQYSSMSARTKYIDKFFEFMSLEKTINSPMEPILIPENPTPSIIEFKDVSFRYPKTERYILKDFNLTLNGGEKIALVGENGAGKTTIIKLLLRFHDPSEGEILINGVNLKEVSIEEWHKNVGALFQDFIKYQFTFKENVYFGKLDNYGKKKLLMEAIERSGADKYLEKLPNGTDQILGKMFESGIDLSGGQWQKLALARAFFRNAPILILDEPTAAIDAKAEYEIFQKVQSLQKDKTVFIISHRFSTVRNADRILVLDGGKIIEQGDHKSLMKKNGLYAELFNIQAQGYK
jgi:ATP-binding cassette, subfamily B, bacterial